MADQEKVNNETGQHQPQQAAIDGAIVIGWDPNVKTSPEGKRFRQFAVFSQLDRFQTLALIKKAELYVLRQISENQPEQSLVQPVGGMPPAAQSEILNGRRIH